MIVSLLLREATFSMSSFAYLHFLAANFIAQWLLPRAAPPVKSPQSEAIWNSVREFGKLMEKHPTSILDISWLPLPKEVMKEVFKAAWLAASTDLERNYLETGYVFLSQFQDGVGNTPADPTLPAALDHAKGREILDRYLRFAPLMQQEGDTLLAEFREFRRRIGRPRS